MFFTNKLVCPKCGEEGIEDKPIPVKYTWIYNMMLKEFTKWIDIFVKNRRQEIMERWRGKE